MKGFILSLGALIAIPAFAVQCGDTVTGTVTLTGNLQCSATSGLTVGANGTVVNLNGHTISCVGTGFMGSCQSSLGQLLPATVGISSTGYDDVIIENGTVSGFATGVYVSKGVGAAVKELKVTGPSAVTPVQNFRAVGKGIVLDMMLPKASRPGIHPAQLVNNQVTNQVTGISLVNANGNFITGNSVHDNNAEVQGTIGISINMGHVNTLVNNAVYHNGMNRLNDAGILIVGEGNVILSNSVNANCGDGIKVANGALNTVIATNAARFNGGSSAFYSCPVWSVRGLVHFDMNELNAGVNNQFNPNNTCRTQSQTIPAGVCGPTE